MKYQPSACVQDRQSFKEIHSCNKSLVIAKDCVIDTVNVVQQNKTCLLVQVTNGIIIDSAAPIRAKGKTKQRIIFICLGQVCKAKQWREDCAGHNNEEEQS